MAESLALQSAITDVEEENSLNLSPQSSQVLIESTNAPFILPQPCVQCTRIVDEDEDTGFSCLLCNKWTHWSCINGLARSGSGLENFKATTMEIQTNIFFFCVNCRKHHDNQYPSQDDRNLALVDELTQARRLNVILYLEIQNAEKELNIKVNEYGSRQLMKQLDKNGFSIIETMIKSHHFSN